MALAILHPRTFPLTKILPLTISILHSSSHKALPMVCSASNDINVSKMKKLPIFLFDIMDTIVRDPFYEDVPAFFGLTMKELLELKHPMAWIEFEKGIITEEELALKFFRDGRAFDFDGLKQCMSNGYAYLDGIESILHRLKSNGYEIHAFTNYPCWYMMIEQKLKLSTYLSWTFCSSHSGTFVPSISTGFSHGFVECIYPSPCTGKRKPEIKAFLDVANQLRVPPSSCIFVDDRLVNVEAASNMGMVGILFENSQKLEQDIISLGIELNSP